MGYSAATLSAFETQFDNRSSTGNQTENERAIYSWITADEKMSIEEAVSFNLIGKTEHVTYVLVSTTDSFPFAEVEKGMRT